MGRTRNVAENVIGAGADSKLTRLYGKNTLRAVSVINLSVTTEVAPRRREVEDKLRRAIVEGQFEPGRRLIERELCALLQVSRTSVREALRQLEAEGLVKTLPYCGPVGL